VVAEVGAGVAIGIRAGCSKRSSAEVEAKAGTEREIGTDGVEDR